MHTIKFLSMRKFYQDKIQTPAGILVVDNNRRMVSLNRKFIEMWCIPKHIIVAQDEEQALEFASFVVEDAESFLNSVKKIYMDMELEISDTIKLRDGRIIERHSLPQYLEEKCVGRIWEFREMISRNRSRNPTAIENQILLFPASYQVK